MHPPLTTSKRQDFILLNAKILNMDIKFIEKLLFYPSALPLIRAILQVRTRSDYDFF